MTGDMTKDAASVLDGIEGLVCDLDGVVYRGDEPVDGSREALERLRSNGIQVVFCTNHSALTVGQYKDKLKSMGIEAGDEDIVTAAVVAAEVLKEEGFEGKRAIVVGGEGLRESVTSMGIEIDDDPETDTADVVVVGRDSNFDFLSMHRASAAVRNGAAFFATNDDATWPVEGGLWPGAGAILASIEVASGRQARVVGKPHRPMMETAARRLSPRKRIAVIGDKAETDLAGGVEMGWKTILALSGVTTDEQVEDIDPPPDAVVESIAELAS